MNYIPPHFDAAQLTILLRLLLAFLSFPCGVFPHVVFFPPSRATSVESLLAPVCLRLLPPELVDAVHAANHIFGSCGKAKN